jgi:hypothetical protein
MRPIDRAHELASMALARARQMQHACLAQCFGENGRRLTLEGVRVV